MELTKEQQKLIDELRRIDSFNSEYKNQKEVIRALLVSSQHSIDEIKNKEIQLKNRELEIEQKSQEKLNQLYKIQKEIEIIIYEKTKSFPWLSTAVADYLHLQDNEIAAFLINKKNPAPVASENVKEISIEKKILIQQLLIARYRINYYETLFPFLTEFNDENIDELLIQVIQEHEKIPEKEDPVTKYITSGEYQNLSITERNQRALDRYLASRKTPYQIGRDYERFIGYKYEIKDFEVKYQGIAEGLEDLGRDLICKRQNRIEIVQCKCWAGHKTIHEKHINQLFGTTVKYYIDYYSDKNKYSNLSYFPELLKEKKIIPVFYTSTKLSGTAKKFADALGIQYFENEPLKEYPIIKCHTNKISGEKIYHLPFDQMYDRTILEKKYGEFYAWSVAEAESKGFRRAWRWSGDS